MEQVIEEDIGTRLIVIVERINQQEIGFFAKLKCVNLLLKQAKKKCASAATAAKKINAKAVLDEFHSFLMESEEPPAFYKRKYFTEPNANLADFNRYLLYVQKILECLPSIIALNEDSEVVKTTTIKLLEDFRTFLDKHLHEPTAFQLLAESLMSAIERTTIEIIEKHQVHSTADLFDRNRLYEALKQLEPMKKSKISTVD